MAQRHGAKFGRAHGRNVGILVRHEEGPGARWVSGLVAPGRGDGAGFGAHPVGDVHVLVPFYVGGVGEDGGRGGKDARVGEEDAGSGGEGHFERVCLGLRAERLNVPDLRWCMQFEELPEA